MIGTLISLRAVRESLNLLFDWRNWYYIFDVLSFVLLSIIIYRLLKDIYFYSKELSKKELSLKSIVENMRAGVIVTDSEGNITFMNEPLVRNWKAINLNYPIPKEEWMKKIKLYYTDRTLMSKTDIPLAKALSGELVTNLEFMIKEDGMPPRYLLANGRGLFDETGDITGSVIVINDITDRKQAESTIKHMACHDWLTGLPNREQFHKNLVQEINFAKQNSQNCSVLLLDLDGFKLVNDTLGHEMGDNLLSQVANRLISNVHPNDLVARQGGDEFIIFLNEADVIKTTKIVETILKSFTYPFILAGKEIVITASIGISIYPTDGQNAETLIKNADTAMYQSKKNGKNNYLFYKPDLYETHINQLSMVNSLRKAMKNQELELVYQPKINIFSNQIVGVEALLRWNNREFGMVSPADFIPLAEEIGLIIEIGEWVLRTAARQNKKWQDLGYSPITVSVNLSARQFLQKDLVHKVEQVLKETGLHPSYLKLEITESIAMHNLEEAISKLEQLKSLGIGLSLDDFGTGFSSLNYLKKFPIDELKIDQSFIRNVDIDLQDAAIVKAIFSIAKSLNLIVVAEGVETKKHVEFLVQQQCDEAQGYYFSRPVPSSEIENVLKNGFQIE